jgi:hypothetical protein
MSLAVLAVVAATVAVVLMWKRPSWRRTQAVLMVVAGVGLAGGLGEALRGWVADLTTTTSSTVTASVFGTAVPWAGALFLVAWFALEMDLDGLVDRARKKSGGERGTGGSRRTASGGNRHTTTAWTPWLGLLVPVALVAVPGGDAIEQAVREFAASVGQVWS